MPFRFDGDSANYLSRTTNLPAINGITVALWYKISVDLNVASQVPIVLYSDVNNFVRLRCGSNGTTMTMLWRSLATSIASSSFTVQAMTVGTWYFLAFTINGATINAYSGSGAGALTNTSGTASGGSTWFTPTNMRMGRDELASPSASDGVLANMKIWTSTVKTQAELERERWFMLPKSTLNLHERYLFQPGASTVGHHNGYNLTVNGSLATEDGPPLTYGGRPMTLIQVPAASADVVLYRRIIEGER